MIDFELQLADIRARLQQVRETEGIYSSLRAWVEYLELRTGYTTSAATALRMEKGTTRLDGEYLLAVLLAKDLSPAWLLLGMGPMYWSAAPHEDAVSLLHEAVSTLRRDEVMEKRRAG